MQKRHKPQKSTDKKRQKFHQKSTGYQNDQDKVECSEQTQIKIPKINENEKREMQLNKFKIFEKAKNCRLISAPYQGNQCFRYSFLRAQGIELKPEDMKDYSRIRRLFSHFIKDANDVMGLGQSKLEVVNDDEDYNVKQAMELCKSQKVRLQVLETYSQAVDAREPGVYLMQTNEKTEGMHALFIPIEQVPLEKQSKRMDDIILSQLFTPEVKTEKVQPQMYIEELRKVQLFGRYQEKQVTKSDGSLVKHVTLPFSYNYGPEGSKVILDLLKSRKHTLHAESFDQRRKHHIPHPMMRSINDYFNYKYLSRMEGRVVDIGSKYTKVAQYVDDLLAFRPTLTHYDESYRDMHPMGITNGQVIDQSVSALEAKQYIGKKVTINANDCIYYPGVQEYINTMVQSKKAKYAIVNFIAMPSYDGDFKAFDDEALAQIRGSKVTFQAKGNEYTYKHDVFQWNPLSPDARSHGDVVWEEQDRCRVGQNLSLVTVRVSLNPQRARSMQALNAVINTSEQQIYDMLKTTQDVVGVNWTKQEKVTKCLPKKMFDFCYGIVMQVEQEKSFNTKKVFRTIQHHWKHYNKAMTTATPDWEMQQLQEAYFASMFKFAGFLDQMETLESTDMVQRITKKGKEPWVWSMIQPTGQAVNIYSLLSCNIILWIIAYIASWGMKTAGPVILMANIIMWMLKNLLSVDTKPKKPKSIEMDLPWPMERLLTVKVRGFKQVHVNREKFNQDVLKPGVGCVNVKTSNYEYDEDLYDNLLKDCECKQTKYQRTGLDHRSNKGQINGFAYETCPINQVYGLHGRHNGSRIIPDHQHVNKFRTMSQYYLEQMMINLDFQKVETLEEYLGKFDTIKAARYMAAFDKFVIDGEVDMRLEIITKTGEIYYGYEDQMSTKRPRNIFNPSYTVKVLGGWINSIVIKEVKKQMPAFIHGINSGQLQEVINAAYVELKDPTIVAWDGASHDSNQHECLIEAVDVYLLKRVLPQIYPKLGIPYDFYKQIEQILCQTTLPYYMRTKQGVQERGSIKGTTFSGHPTRTTLGNTLRVYYYIKYIQGISGIREEDIRCFVSGDDSFVFLERDQHGRFMQAFYEVYTEPRMGIHGLAQVVKMVEHTETEIEFLSKTITMTPYGFQVTRLPSKAITSGTYTKKLREGFSKRDHRQMILSGIYSWGRDAPIFDNYVPKKYLEQQEYGFQANINETDLHYPSFELAYQRILGKDYQQFESNYDGFRITGFERAHKTTHKTMLRKQQKINPNKQKNNALKQEVKKNMEQFKKQFANDKRAQQKVEKAQDKLTQAGTNYLASVIYPEEYLQARVPTPFPVSSATQHYYGVMNMETNLNGDAMVIVSPQNQSGFIVNQYNLPVLDLNVGVTPGAAGTSSINGAYALVQNAASYRVVSCSCRITFTGNISQNQGFLGGAYVGEALNGAPPVINRPFIDKYPNSKRVRADAGMRLVWYPRDTADTNYQLLVSNQKGVLAFYATGMLPSATVGQIEVWTNIEYFPSIGFQSMIDRSMIPSDPRALQAMETTIANNPGLFTSTQAQAQKKSAQIRKSGGFVQGIRKALEYAEYIPEIGTAAKYGGLILKGVQDAGLFGGDTGPS